MSVGVMPQPGTDMCGSKKCSQTIKTEQISAITKIVVGCGTTPETNVVH
jgi:hypothetical protein